jgi:glucan-binding YG repeat protein
MNKNIKWTIAAMLVISAFSGALPAKDFMFGNIEVYAATYNAASKGELSSLSIIRGNNDEIELRDSYDGDEVSLSSQPDYYIELSGAEGVDIKAEVAGDGYVVKTFTSGDKTEEGKDIEDFIKVDSAHTNIYLRTYKSEYAYKDAYDDEDVTDCEKTYVIHVRKPVAISDEELDTEYAYLKSIYLSDGSINFSKTETSYNINVKDSIDEILVRATPEDTDSLVDINDASVTYTDNYEKTVKLNKGNNTITIYVEGDDDNNTYNINVFRGDSVADLATASKTEMNGNKNTQNVETKNYNNKTNTWKNASGKLKYLDGTGQALKNQWWFDKNTGKNYYLKEDGDRAKGWLQDKNNWYYFNKGGEMQTGWVCIDNNWYYFNKGGAMKIGWYEDIDGNWYYLDSIGRMINDSTIDEFKLGANGALVN